MFKTTPRSLEGFQYPLTLWKDPGECHLVWLELWTPHVSLQSSRRIWAPGGNIVQAPPGVRPQTRTPVVL